MLDSPSFDRNFDFEAVPSANQKRTSPLMFGAQRLHNNYVNPSRDNTQGICTNNLAIQLGHGIKIKRVKTDELPLESIHNELAMHDLTAYCLDDIGEIGSLARQLSKFDIYSQSGTAAPALAATLSAEAVARWESILIEMIKSMYQCETKELHSRIRLSLNFSSNLA